MSIKDKRKKELSDKKDKKEKKQSVKFDTYKGTPVISLPTGSNFKPYFSFGAGKAKLIVKYFPQIKAFAKRSESESDDE